MQKQRYYTIAENYPAAAGIWRMRLEGDVAGFAPGRFANVLVPGHTLRRPLAISNYDGSGFSLFYKLAGPGTRDLTLLGPGGVLDVLAPLGNGFTPKKDRRVLLAGGGCGVAPLHLLARALAANGCRVDVALGFNTAGEAYLLEELAAHAQTLDIATADGTMGTRGLVTDLLDGEREWDYFYACGPTAMLRAVCKALPGPGEVSLEERMACGFGGCMGCAIETAQGMRRVCADGPVFAREVLGW